MSRRALVICDGPGCSNIGISKGGDAPPLWLALNAKDFCPRCAPKRKLPHHKELIDRCEEILGTPSGAIRGPRRDRVVQRDRDLVCYTLRNLTDLPLLDIAFLVGRADHSSAAAAVTRAEKRVNSEPEEALRAQCLRDQLPLE